MNPGLEFSSESFEVYEQTVSVVAIVPGDEGYPSYILSRTGSQWFSSYQAAPRAIQGDPRRIIALLGPKAAAKLGFRMISDNLLLVPGPDELNARITRLNLVLSDSKKITVKFFKSDVSNLSDLKFLSKWTYQTMSPLDTKQLLPHDASYHTGVIFFPPSMIEFNQRQSRQILEFVLYVKGAHPKIKNVSWVRDFFDILIKKQAIGIDVGSGNILPSYFEAKTDESIHLRAIGQFIHFGDSPLATLGSLFNQALKQVLEEVYPEYSNRQRFTFPLAIPPTVTSRFRSGTIRELNELMQAYRNYHDHIASSDNPATKTYDEIETKEYEKYQDKFVSAIRERIAEIKLALENL